MARIMLTIETPESKETFVRGTVSGNRMVLPDLCSVMKAGAQAHAHELPAIQEALKVLVDAIRAAAE
jgi:hypothetical protein